MKFKPEIIFGGIAAAAGVYVAWRAANQPPPNITVSQLPPLQAPSFSSAAPSVAALPSATYQFTTNHYDAAPLAPITMQSLATPPPLTSDVGTPLYQVSNFSPDHDATKAYQAVQQYNAQTAAQPSTSGGCSCSSPCGSCDSTPQTVVGVTPGIISRGVFNLQTIGATPQPSYGNSDTILDSSIAQFYATQGAATTVAQLTGQGQTPIGNVPTLHNDHLQGYAA